MEKLKILRDQEAFYFCYPTGNFTGYKACSMEEFVQQIGIVDLSSLEFHLYREDFEKWITHSLEDATLAKSIEVLRRQKPNRENLRANLLNLVNKRLATLKKPARTTKAVTKTINTKLQ